MIVPNELNTWWVHQEGNYQKGVEINPGERCRSGRGPVVNGKEIGQLNRAGCVNKNWVTANGQLVMAMFRMLLMVGVSPVVHIEKGDKRQIYIVSPMCLIMLHQVAQVDRLVNAETGE